MFLELALLYISILRTYPNIVPLQQNSLQEALIGLPLLSNAAKQAGGLTRTLSRELSLNSNQLFIASEVTK